jgi:hypothetical protein
MRMKPKDVVRLAAERGLGVQFEVGEKHGGTGVAGCGCAENCRGGERERAGRRAV